MVLQMVRRLCADRYGCEEEDVVLTASIDELNLTPDELDDMSVALSDAYGVTIPDDAMASFVTIEDIVGYVEDRL